MLARPLVVVEYAQYGDVLGYLRKSRGVRDNYYNDPSVQPRTNLTSKQLLTFAWEISDGMVYLSKKKVINCLTDRIYLGQITDCLFLSFQLLTGVCLLLTLGDLTEDISSLFCLLFRSSIVIWPLGTSWWVMMKCARSPTLAWLEMYTKKTSMCELMRCIVVNIYKLYPPI